LRKLLLFHHRNGFYISAGIICFVVCFHTSTFELHGDKIKPVSVFLHAAFLR
jgi:hypothetical protein